MDTPTLTEVKRALTDLGKTHQQFRETNDERLAAIEKGDTSFARELDQKLSRMNDDIEKFLGIKKDFETAIAVERERLDDLEARGLGHKRKEIDLLQDEHSELFEKALRAQFDDGESKNELRLHEKKLIEAKAITVGTGAAGGFAVPEVIGAAIEKQERLFNPMREIVKVTPTGRADYRELVNIGGTASGWVGESGTRSETDTPLLRERAPTHGELYAYPQVSEWSLDDMFFDVENWLVEEVSEEFAIQESAAILSGNGTNRPTGMTNTAPVATADGASPLRAAAAYQFIASAASPAAVVADALFDLVYAVNQRYRVASRWTMNSLTTASVRKLADSNGQYHWQPGLQLGEPDRLLGYPHTTWEAMDDVGAGQDPIAFGNFRRAYLLNVITGMRMTLDNVTNPGFVRFYIRRREGGTPLNNDAVKFLRTT